METLSTIVLLTPVFLPALLVLGVDPVQFGILFVVLSEVGFLTPPLGVNLYVASAIYRESVEKVSVAVLPFVGVLLFFSVSIDTVSLAFHDWLPAVHGAVEWRGAKSEFVGRRLCATCLNGGS